MPYYDTLDEDLARAKAILRKGKPAAYELANFTPEVVEALRQTGGGTIFGADVYAAYKLLESFVEAIEALRRDAERERAARRVVDEALREALMKNEQLRRGWDDEIVP